MQLSPLISIIEQKIDNFEFVAGKTPLSSPTTVVIAIIFYLSTTFLLTQLMKNREAIKLRAIVSVHNLILTGFSAVTLAMVFRHAIPIVYNRGYHTILCDPQSDVYTKGPLVFWFYIFYLSKMYEFLDTFFQCFRKKSLQFLHVWHHCTTLVLCWVSINYAHPMQMADIPANLLVHTVMYYYYYLTDQGINVWWKKYITRLQIAQFVWDIYWHCAWYIRSLSHTCNGGVITFHVANFIIGSFLLLFIQFYFRTYTNKKGSKEKNI